MTAILPTRPLSVPTLQLVVVLGMHRSGTSTLTRSLMTMGVSLGDSHLPAKNDNQKGFWEDQEIVSFNEDLLAACGQAWFTLTPIDESDVDGLVDAGYLDAACSILRRKTSEAKIFAFKDPRVSKLLPFWQRVIAKEKLQTRFVLALRNPKSVARSLRERDLFDNERSYFLWLSYVMTCLKGTDLDRIYIVDYDALLEKPRAVLERLSNWLGLPLDHKAVEEYCLAYLDSGLRHALNNKEDFFDDRGSPLLAKKIFTFLASFCDDPKSFDRQASHTLIDEWSIQFEQFFPLMKLIDQQEFHLRQALEQLTSFSQLSQELERSKTNIQRVIEREQSQSKLIHTLMIENQGLRSSRSWRFTAPLRLVGELFRRSPVLMGLKQSVFLLFTKAAWLTIHKQAKQHRGHFGLLLSVFLFVRRKGLRTALRSIRHHFSMSDDERGYERWIEFFGSISEERRDQIRQEISFFHQKPLFSVVMPVYNPPVEFLRLAIESVLTQLYQQWELCIADDASTDERVHKCLREFEARDSRIKVIYRKVNGHISAASNSALSLAQGDFIVLLDQDDLLPDYALFKVAEAINTRPDLSLIYSDEDKVDTEGQRFDPYFKSDWNPDLIYSQNLFSHLGVLRRSLVNKVGGFRKGLEGSQDYDLLLRCLEKVGASEIFHIPHVLYHWRAHHGSTAITNEAKPYAAVAGERALNEHFSRSGVIAQAHFSPAGYRLDYGLPNPKPSVSILLTEAYEESLVFERADRIAELTDYPCLELKVTNRRNLAQVAKDSKADFLCFLNPYLTPLRMGWLALMLSYAIRPGVGAVGARLLYSDKSILHTGLVLSTNEIATNAHHSFPDGHFGYFGRIALASTVSAVSADCMVVRRDTFINTGGFDEELSLPQAGSVDFCLRLSNMGLRSVYAADAILQLDYFKWKGRNAKDYPYQLSPVEKGLMQQRWADRLRNDPYYSPNLNPEPADYSLAWPPRTPGL